MPSDRDTVERLRAEVALLERQLAAVARLAGELSSITKLDATIQEALRVSLELVDAHAGSIILHDDKKDKLVFRYVIGEAAADLMGMELETDQGIAGAVFHSGQTRVSEDVTKERDHDSGVGEKIHYLTQNMVTVPLKTHENRCIGVMQVLNKSDGHFNEHDVATLDILGAQVAAAIEAARLQEEARLAQVVNFIGDISHDVKNMITPVQTSAETIRFISDDVFAQFDRTLEDPDWSPTAADRVRATVQELRDLLPEMVDLILDGADTVQQRMAEISAAVKGLVSQPHFEKADVLDVARRAVALLEHQASKAEITVGVEAVGEVPEVLTREMSWNEYEAQPRPKDAPSPATFEGRIELQRRDRTVTLAQRRSDEGAPPDTGALIVSLHGDKTRLKRRAEAETAIRGHTNPMPQLRHLLEGLDVAVPRYGGIAPVTPNVRRKVFGARSPTPTQEKALRVALNTPDIALIQGPPGTGKTTVIVALVERLQEVWDTQDGVQGRLLLSQAAEVLGLVIVAHEQGGG